MTRTIIAVSGGRFYADYPHVKRVLDEERSLCPNMAVVQGECPTTTQGADGLAKRWCRENGLPCIGIEAHFRKFGKAAGPIRNDWIFDLLPVAKLVAFPGGPGTTDAVAKAHRRSIPVRDERDSGRLPKGGDDPSSAPCEASQSGDSEAGASPSLPK